MDFLKIILIAFGLAMDAFAVSVANGFIIRKGHLAAAIKFGLFFGFFQMFMPLLGWAGGVRLREVLQSVDHWIAFGILAFIGGKMILEALSFDGSDTERTAPGFAMLITLSVATSIDALAVGVSFAFLGVAIMVPAVTIGAVTFAASFAGVFIGSRFGHFFEKKIECAGGLVLIGIGTMILLEHLRV
ncbi:MAG: manganese efflux pump [Candidatus Omnitrophica bacterium]|nr:manganese efflux pump [Candidatus Omnitrophota bacterium]